MIENTRITLYDVSRDGIGIAPWMFAAMWLAGIYAVGIALKESALADFSLGVTQGRTSLVGLIIFTIACLRFPALTLRVLVGRGYQLEPRLTGGIVSRVYFQKAVENFVSVIEILQHDIGSRKVEVSRGIKWLDLERFFI
jgi:hypothetical protein